MNGMGEKKTKMSTITHLIKSMMLFDLTRTINRNPICIHIYIAKKRGEKKATAMNKKYHICVPSA